MSAYLDNLRRERRQNLVSRVEFVNSCHDENGRFCESQIHGKNRIDSTQTSKKTNKTSIKQTTVEKKI